MRTNRWPTLELRWFLPGEIPEDVDEWFRDEGPLGTGLGLAAAEHRTETYLVPADVQDMMLKVRDDKIEVKRRERVHSEIGLGNAMGKPETWQKWIWADPSFSGIDVSAGPFRFDVHKIKYQRRLRLLKVTERIESRFEPLGTGFFLELTSVVVADQHWWTFAFDVHPQMAEKPPLQLLREAVHWTLADYPPRHLPDLRPANSYSYAQWLSQLTEPLTQRMISLSAEQ